MTIKGGEIANTQIQENIGEVKITPDFIFNEIGTNKKFRTDDLKELLEELLDSEKLRYQKNEQGDIGFTYRLITPIRDPRGEPLTSLFFREPVGIEMSNASHSLQQQNLVGYTMDILAAQNGIPATYLERLKSRDINNLSLLFVLFT